LKVDELLTALSHASGCGRSEVVLSTSVASFQREQLWQQNESHAVGDLNTPVNQARPKLGFPRTGTPLLISGGYG
jgi:hypothetical protein